jgi:prevent-host-death family protein
VEVTNVQEAKTHLSRLLERVQDGNEILIGKAVKPIAKLVPFSPSDQPRQIGGWEN